MCGADVIGPRRGLAPSLAWSLANCPAASMPVGMDAHGLRAGLSLASSPGNEADLVRIATALDQAVPYGADVLIVATAETRTRAGSTGRPE